MAQVNLPPKVCVFRGSFDTDVINLFRVRGWNITRNSAEADLIVLTGGVDINPALYGHARISETQYPSDARDKGEMNIYRRFINTPKVGICRGGQLLNVANGGLMWQHVDNHDGETHFLRDSKRGVEAVFKVTSMHHQMMIPGDGGEVFATADKATLFKMGDDDRTTVKIDAPTWDDVEGVWYPDTKSLCYQPHPEFGSFEERAYFFEIIQRYFDLSKKGPLGSRFLM